MTLLPILTRELRARSRNRATYWTRFAVGVVGVIVCLPQLLGVASGSTPSSVGRYVFNGLLTAAFLLSCFACLFTIEAIHSERKEGTLGLLFLTRVRALDVLLGKLASVGIGLLCTLVAFLPVMALPILAGGVTVGEAFRKWLAVIAVLFLAVTVGLYAASIQELRTKAWLRAAVVMVIVLFVPAWLSQIYSGAAPGSQTPWLALPSPLMTLLYGSDSAYSGAARPFWLSLVAVGGVGCLLLLRAKRGLLRSLSQGPVAAQSAAPEERLPLLPPSQAASELVNPVERLVLRQRGLLAAIWTGALMSAIFQTGLIPLYSWRMIPFRASWWMLAQVPYMAVSIITGALFAWAASRFFVQARRDGELELLLTTPQGAATIVSGQWQALKRMLRWPVVVMVAPLLLRVWFVLQRPSFASSPLRTVYAMPIYELSALLLSAAATVLCLVAICWLGMWFGLKARSQAGAIGWTVGLAKGAPYLVSIVWSTMLVPLTGIFRTNPAWPYLFLSWVPTLLILLGYGWLIQWARRGLSAGLTGLEAKPLSLRRFSLKTAGDLGAAIEKARRWTPS